MSRHVHAADMGAERLEAGMKSKLPAMARQAMVLLSTNQSIDGMYKACITEESGSDIC